MSLADVTRVRVAADRARRLYPGPVGEVIARELGIWVDFGYRLNQTGLVARLVEHVLTAHAPDASSADPLAWPPTRRLDHA